MVMKVKGKESDYIVKNESSIFQYKLDENGQKTGKSILHIITDSIENREDRDEVIKTIEEYNLN